MGGKGWGRVPGREKRNSQQGAGSLAGVSRALHCKTSASIYDTGFCPCTHNHSTGPREVMSNAAAVVCPTQFNHRRVVPKTVHRMKWVVLESFRSVSPASSTFFPGGQVGLPSEEVVLGRKLVHTSRGQQLEWVPEGLCLTL